MVSDFEKKYPDTQVKWVDQPAEGYADKISADAAGGTLPDVVNVSPDLVAPLAKAGLALDLDKAAAKYRKEYLPGAWASHRIPGMTGTYAFPWYLNTGPLFYNKSLFKDAGLDASKPRRPTTNCSPTPSGWRRRARARSPRSPTCPPSRTSAATASS